MNAMEKAALKHYSEYLRYSRSQQSVTDRLAGIAQSAARDRAAGHVPGCGLHKCAPNCPRSK